MRGLLRKIYFETRLSVLLFGIGLALVMSLLTALLPKVLGDIDKLFGNLPFIKPILAGFLGFDPGERFTAQMMQAFLWVHPTVLALIWAHELMFCSRIPAAEIDRGSIDFLLGLPVSRWKLYVAETIGWLVTGAVIVAVGFTGHTITSSMMGPIKPPAKVAPEEEQEETKPNFGTWLLEQFTTPQEEAKPADEPVPETTMQLDAATTCFVLVNLYAVYVAVGGLTFLISSMCDRRGRAIGFMFGLLLFSFLLNFLAQFWEPARSFSFLSVMDYYRPAIIIESGAFPIREVSTLLLIGGIAWTAGGVILRRRSICTV